jgi:putative redox protein
MENFRFYFCDDDWIYLPYCERVCWQILSNHPYVQHFNNYFYKNTAMTSKVIYLGNLRTAATHLRSGSIIETDAPVDNQGKGERFSPTDLVATALATCIVTTIAILAPSINIDGAECTVEKIMVSNPRKIGEIVVNIDFPMSGPYTDEEKKRLEHIAVTCPVHQTLHPDCKRTIKFNWPNG